MDYRETTWYSDRVNRHMNIKIYGWGGTPILVFPCQDSMSNNFADFGMIDTISDLSTMAMFSFSVLILLILRAGLT